VTGDTNVFSGLARRLPGKTGSKKSSDARNAREPVARQLVLLLPFGWPDTAGRVRWCIRSDDSVEDQGVIDSLEELDSEVKTLPLKVLLDPFDTSILTASLPSMSRKNLLRAVPYALEDRLLGDVEKQFFTLLPPVNGTTTACVIAHDRMKAVLAGLGAAGLQPEMLQPAISTAPLLENAWTIVFNDRAGWIRTSTHNGTAFPLDDSHIPYAIKNMISSAKEKDDAPTALLIIGAPENPELKKWSGDAGLELMQPEGGLWENLAREDSEFNLLQGPYKQKTSTQTSSNRLRLAIILGLVLVIGNTGVFGYDWFHMYMESRRINLEMTTIFKQSFPDQASTVFDPSLQMQSNLDRLRQEKGGASSTDFLALLSPVSRSLSADQVRNASVQKIQYMNKEIVVEVRLPDYQALDRLKQSFNDNKLAVEVMQAERSSEGVKATLKLRTRQENQT